MRFIRFSAIALLVACGGSECGNLGLDIPNGSRERVQFRITLNITHATEDSLEAQNVIVTSWRKLPDSDIPDEGSTIETRYDTEDDVFTAHVLVEREYYFASSERIVFEVLSTGATTQGKKTLIYHLSESYPEILFDDKRVIVETEVVYCRPTTTPDP
jgi:hypothetical protein